MDQKIFREPSSRILFFTGLGMCLASLVLFHLGGIFGPDRGMMEIGLDDPFFIGCYLFAAAFMIATLAVKFQQDRWRGLFRFEPGHFRIGATLFMISSFALNRDMSILGDFPAWVVVYLYLSYMGLILDVFASRLPILVRHINMFLAGLGTVMTLYFVVVMAPVMPFGLAFFFVFGISLHAISPLISLLAFFGVFRRRKSRALRYSYLAGVVLPFLAIIWFSVSWGNLQRDLEAIVDNYEETDKSIPLWAYAAQYLPESTFNDWILTTEHRHRPIGSVLMGPNWGRNEINDPLIVLGSTFHGRLPFDYWDIRMVMAARTDLRHKSQRRLWSGDHLRTREVDTEIEVYPEYRLAYTEKTLQVEHFGVGDRRFDGQEEAVYTFHLPEGSVATSLSLWINGKEEKARFTTKSKADNAYQTIVGREVRDPALLHWQEGNTLVVTVFPVSPDLPRKFKLGVTTPLKAQDDRLVLENIYFEGPSVRFAGEKARIRFSSEPEAPELPGHFDEENDLEYLHEGSYRPYWEMSVGMEDLSSKGFSFNGKEYKAQPFVPEREKRSFDRIYLDVNKTWSQEEYHGIWEMVKDREVYAYTGHLQPVTEDNFQQVYDALKDANFSLFPVHKIGQTQGALLISRSGQHSITRHDLDGSSFRYDMDAFLEKNPEPLAFFNLGHKLSPYLKTLKESRVLNYAKGGKDDLRRILERDEFPQHNTDPALVVLEDSKMVIEESQMPSQTQQTDDPEAPDHLMRLFAYNKVMEEAGVCFMRYGDVRNETIRRAEEAYVVTPATSLVVLESQEDYERFGIDESDGSLGNAGLNDKMGGAGSVPEPHEWLLIGLVAFVLIWTQRKRFRRRIA